MLLVVQCLLFRKMWLMLDKRFLILSYFWNSIVKKTENFSLSVAINKSSHYSNIKVAQKEKKHTILFQNIIDDFSISLDNLMKHKPLISEECVTCCSISIMALLLLLLYLHTGQMVVPRIWMEKSRLTFSLSISNIFLLKNSILHLIFKFIFKILVW